MKNFNFKLNTTKEVIKNYLKSLNIIYTAYRPNECIENLYSQTPINFKRVLNPHITLKFRPTIDELLEEVQNIPQKQYAFVKGYGCSATNEGIKVVLNYFNEAVKSGIPHITLSVANGGKPFDTIKINFTEVYNGKLFDKDWQVICKFPKKLLVEAYAFTTNGWISFNEIIQNIQNIVNNPAEKAEHSAFEKAYEQYVLSEEEEYYAESIRMEEEAKNRR